jgi:hypothetical protein
MAYPATGRKNGAATVAKRIFVWNIVIMRGKREQKRK